MPLTQQSTSLENKIFALQDLFLTAKRPEDKYHLLIQLGKKLPPLEAQWKVEENLVKGCQSQLYLRAEKKEGLLFFSAATDALISAGLAYLLIEVYSGETMETILTKPPVFLQTLGFHTSLSPSRSNGLSYIYLKMKQLSIR